VGDRTSIFYEGLWNFLCFFGRDSKKEYDQSQKDACRDPPDQSEDK
jgi:hypothetical protein